MKFESTRVVVPQSFKRPFNNENKQDRETKNGKVGQTIAFYPVN